MIGIAGRILLAAGLLGLLILLRPAAEAAAAWIDRVCEVSTGCITVRLPIGTVVLDRHLLALLQEKLDELWPDFPLLDAILGEICRVICRALSRLG